MNPKRIVLPADLHAHAANGQPRNDHGVIYEPAHIGPVNETSWPSPSEVDQIITDVSMAIVETKSTKVERIKAALEIAKGEI
jgi:hypothetical protein